MKVLIITYYWPPSGGVGVQRWMNYALQLKDAGHEPIILTPENPQFSIKDEALKARVKDIKTYKVPIWEPFDFFHKLTGNTNKNNVKQGLVLEKKKKTLFDEISVWVRGNLFLPDPRVFWVRQATLQAKKIIAEEAIAHIITTGPPHSMHLIGRKLKRSITSLFWLADFRDPWSEWDILKELKTGIIAQEIHRRLEDSILKEADMVVSVSNRLTKGLNEANVLYNGITVSKKTESLADKNKFTIGYFGMLNELRNPKQYWLLLDQMCREHSDFAEKLVLKIGGIISDSIRNEIMQLEYLSKCVQFIGYLSHDEVQEAYASCNVLLLLLNKSDNSQWILPLKFFEYLTARKLILALGPRTSDLADIMKGRDVGEILEYNEINQIRSFLMEVFEDNKLPDNQDIDQLIDDFSHKNQSKKLIRWLTEHERK